MSLGSILLVEDNEDDADLTILAFKRANLTHEVVVASDGAVALDMLHGENAFAGTRSGMPDLVLLDLNLPRVPGLEVLKRLRERADTRYLPVVVLTTSGEESDVLGSYAAGANAYVRKPVAFEDFLGAIARTGLFWLSTNVRAPDAAN
jgi:two-component system response regulator